MNGIMGMNFRRLGLICFGLAGAALLSGCSSIVKDSYEIYPGQNLVGTLRVEGGGSRLKVSTDMQVAPTGYVFSSTGQTIKVDNRYSREEVQGTGSIGLWKINTEFLTEPKELSIIVAGARFNPTAVLFVDATEEEILDGDKEGFALPSSDTGEVAGTYIFQPKTSYYLTVRSRGKPVTSDYKVELVDTQELRKTLDETRELLNSLKGR